jgi:hypothetical protein
MGIQAIEWWCVHSMGKVSAGDVEYDVFGIRCHEQQCEKAVVVDRAYMYHLCT